MTVSIGFGAFSTVHPHGCALGIPPFLQAVRRYSERVGHDTIALNDRAAVLHER